MRSSGTCVMRDRARSARGRRRPMHDLVQRLCQGEHPVQLSTRPEPTIDALKRSLDRGYVLIRFTDTKGGTELGVPVDRERTDTTAADFDAKSGTLTLVGALTLDYSRVRCTAKIDL